VKKKRLKIEKNGHPSLRRPRFYTVVQAVTLLVDKSYISLHIKPKGEKSVAFSVPFSFVTGLMIITQGQDITVSKFEHMAAMIKHQDVVLTSDEWKIVLNTDTDQYDQSLDKSRAEVQEITQTTFYSVYKHELEQITNLLNSF
jgi:hypothetical protein